MRKLIMMALMAATALPATGAVAQTRELQRDRQEIREQRQDLRQAQRYGDRRDIREERRDVREARQEYREDWRDYRKRNGNLFRQGRYVAPRGVVYRPVRQGVNLNRAFYNQRYWISDPYRYRLPRVGPNQRWVRYGNDVLLVNIRNGRVLAVNSGFFW
jgi:Ni/Co efflux regulator RcnB